MRFNKMMLAMLALSVTGLYGCSEGDKSSLVIEGDTTTTTNNNGSTDSGDGSTSTVSENCPDWASAKNKDGDGNDVCQLPSSIDEDVTLTSDIVWYLQGRVTVGNGNGEMSDTQGTLENGTAVENVTLTIEAGTQIKGATGTFANLLITRGSMIEANGTADAPIIMSSYDDGYDGSGEWGGLIIQGYGDHNECSALPCNVDAEGESGFAGGFGTPEDSSGNLSYVIVTEGGYEFAPGDEINGISLVAVGSGTTMDHIQVNANSDDGIEFFGGAVKGKYIVLTGNQDDSLDWDEGFQGNLQYIIVKQDAETGDKGIEADTLGTSAFLSMPTVANATFIGNGLSANLIELKEATGGYLINSVATFLDSPTNSVCVHVSDDALGNITDGTLVFFNVLTDCDSFGNTDLEAVSTLFPEAADLDANYASQAADATLSAAISWSTLAGTYSNLTADSDYLDETDFVGAVNPDGSDVWWEGWILDGTL